MVILLKCLRDLICTVSFFVFGKGGVLVCAGKNVALMASSLLYHHENFADAATAVSLPLICLAGDGLWYGAIWVLKNEKVKAALAKLTPFRDLGCWRVSQAG